MDSIPSSSWQRVVVLAVHPDDESLSAGGLIQQAIARGGDVRVVVVTDGDNNPWPQRFVERRWHIDAAARVRWGQRRGAEAVAALARLGVPQENISFWHYPDQGLTRVLLSGGEGLIAKLTAVIRQRQPTLLVAPSMRDLHPDHNALAVLVDFALVRAAVPPRRACTTLNYVVHTRDAETPGPHFQVTLSPQQVELKRQAILRHATQMALSRRRFLAFAKPTEDFEAPSPPANVDPSHPIFGADFIRGFLCLRAKDLTSPATLFLAGETAAGAVRLAIKLSPGAEPALCRTFSDERQGEAHLVREPAHDEILLPAALFASMRSLFVKITADAGFYDRAGWRQVPVASAPAAAAIENSEDRRAAEPRVCCVIPCYNLAGICGPIVRAAAGFAGHVIAVNDGSSDETERVLRTVAEECAGRVEVLNFPVNRGKGVALLEAFRHAIDTVPFDVLVTLDGDGQHRPEDVPRLVRAAVGGNCSLVIGERLARVKMPLRSRLGNTLTAAVMKLLQPSAPTDTQSGFRAFDRDFAREIVGTIEGGRYETELEILLLALRQRRRIGSVTIPTVYLDGNRLSHFRPVVDSCRIYRTLFRRHFAPADQAEAKAALAADRKLDLPGLDSGGV